MAKIVSKISVIVIADTSAPGTAATPVLAVPSHSNSTHPGRTAILSRMPTGSQKQALHKNPRRQIVPNDSSCFRPPFSPLTPSLRRSAGVLRTAGASTLIMKKLALEQSLQHRNYNPPSRDIPAIGRWWGVSDSIHCFMIFVNARAGYMEESLGVPAPSVPGDAQYRLY